MGHHPAEHGAQRPAQPLGGHDRTLPEIDVAGAVEQAGHQAGHRHREHAGGDAVEQLHRDDAPAGYETRGHQSANRQGTERDQDGQPVAAGLRDPHRRQGGWDHHGLGDDDGAGRGAERVGVGGDHGQSVERQDRRICQPKQRDRRPQDQQRRVAQQDPELGDRRLGYGTGRPPRDAVVDAGRRNLQDGDDGDPTERGGQPEHPGVADQ